VIVMKKIYRCSDGFLSLTHTRDLQEHFQRNLGCHQKYSQCTPPIKLFMPQKVFDTYHAFHKEEKDE